MTFAAWRHRDARDGFEVAFLDERDGGVRIEGHTAAVETASRSRSGTRSSSTAAGTPARLT